MDDVAYISISACLSVCGWWAHYPPNQFSIVATIALTEVKVENPSGQHQYTPHELFQTLRQFDTWFGVDLLEFWVRPVSCIKVKRRSRTLGRECGDML